MEEQQKPHSMFWGILSYLVGHFTFCPCQFLTRMVEFDIISLSCELWSWLYIHDMKWASLPFFMTLVCLFVPAPCLESERMRENHCHTRTLISWDSLAPHLLVPWITGYLLPGPLDFLNFFSLPNTSAKSRFSSSHVARSPSVSSRCASWQPWLRSVQCHEHTSWTWALTAPD